jgi:ferredoxin
MERTPIIREDDCIACGACEDALPAVFRVPDGLAFAQVINPWGAEEAAIEEVMEICPTHCIHWSYEV